MDIEIGLDPIHKEWCVSRPIDFGMQKAEVNPESCYTRWETGKGRNKCMLAIAYSNPENDPTQPGTLNIHWSRGQKGSGEVQSIHWTINCTDFIDANDTARQFMLLLPEWLEPENGDW